VLFTLFALGCAAAAQTDAQRAFATIKSLPGIWEGKGHDGQALQVTFKITGGGSAVLSEIQVPKEDMVSMIHLDGPDRLLLRTTARSATSRECRQVSPLMVR
jgi:hypothetical protein